MSVPLKVIYILGVSYSGSSLLSFLIGGHPEVTHLGELRAFYQKDPSFVYCTCGTQSNDCPFWKRYWEAGFNIFEDPPLRKRLMISLNTLLKNKVRQNIINDSEDFKLLSMISTDLETPTYLLDNSKNLWRLSHLMKCKGIELEVIYIRRAFEPNVASFIKHKQGFLTGIFVYKLKHWLSKRFIQSNPSLRVHTISYESLCETPDQEMNKIGQFLRLNMELYATNLKSSEFHVRTGNIGPINQLLKGDLSIKLDRKWEKTLTSFQRLVLRLIGYMGINKFNS